MVEVSNEPGEQKSKFWVVTKSHCQPEKWVETMVEMQIQQGFCHI